MSNDRPGQVRTQWRLTGSHPELGPWVGNWRDSSPTDSSSSRNSLFSFIDRNDEVFVETRDVWESEPISVPAAEYLEAHA